MFHSNHGPISCRFLARRQFQSKIAKFSHPLVFCVSAEGVPLELGISAEGQKTRMMGLPGQQKKFDDIFSCPDRMYERDRQTDTRPQERPCLCAVKVSQYL